MRSQNFRTTPSRRLAWPQRAQHSLTCADRENDEAKHFLKMPFKSEATAPDKFEGEGHG